MAALLISRLTCNASTAILGVTNRFILSVIDSRGKQKRGFCFVLTNPLQGTTLRCQRLLCIYNAGDTHNSEVSWPQVQTQHERWYIKLTLSQLGKKKEKKNTSDLYQACLPSINTNIKLQPLLYNSLKVLWYSTRAKWSKSKVFPNKIIGREGRKLMNLERNFKLTEATAHSDLHYPPFTFVPHLTYWHTSIYCFYAFFPPYPCVCVSPIPGMVSKNFKQILKTCIFYKASEPQASFNWAINKTALKKPKMKQGGFFPPEKVSVGYLEWNRVFPYSGSSHLLCTFGVF